VLESGSDEKRKEGESSSAELDAPDTHEPRRRGEGAKRFKALRLGSPSLYLSFKFN
jgi:hypothetical protein